MSHSKSICSANSRDLRRSVMLTAPPATRRAFGLAARRSGGLASNLAYQLPHFHSRETRLVTFIAGFQAGTVNRLLQRVTGEHAKNQRHAGIELRELNSARGFRHHHVVVRCFAAQNATDANDR